MTRSVSGVGRRATDGRRDHLSPLLKRKGIEGKNFPLPTVGVTDTGCRTAHFW